jgi:glycosyltransferase involved in cell wall biosynthesis
LWREVRRLLRTRRYDLLHSHGVTAAAHSAMANMGLAYPHVATLHDVFRPCHFAGFGGFVKRPVLAYLLGQIDTLIPVSGDVRANLFDYLPPLMNRESSVVPIPNGITGVAEQAAPSADFLGLRQELGLGGGVYLIGFLGRFMEQKGFLPLIHALRKLLDLGTPRAVHLVALGTGDYRNEYAAVVRRLRLDGHVTFLDFTPDVRPVLAQLDLLAIPSLWEASSLVGMEALCAGVPVLGTNCIGLREVLRDTPARTVNAGDAGALAAGLRDALDRPWLEEATAFVPVARQRFDNAPSARRLADVFADLLRRRQRPRH